MRTMLEIDSKTAAQLRKLAEAQHVSVEEFLAVHVRGLTGDEIFENGSGEDLERAFEEWIADFPKDTPLLSDEAISRASIYGDR